MRSFLRPQFLALAFVTILAATSTAAEPLELPKVDFRRQIQPILAEYCSHCHGSDSSSRQGGLRLDVDTLAYQGGESGSPAITPHDPLKSLMLARVRSKDPDEMMPPPHTNKSITESEVTLLEQWIDQGAKYESHWAFSPPMKSVKPSSDMHPIDALVSQRLQKIGVAMAEPASVHTLVRRLYLDIVGFPPTPQQVATVVNSHATTKEIESTIDQLLGSEHYGEKWARHWLDVARYSDSNGYEKDLRREQWAWRDWVINAIQRDMPFDQFIIEQIAGDLLPDATSEQIVATGFLRNSMINEEGAIVPEQFRMVEMFDRIDCIGKATLGLTTQCAQCHTHKFDPITHDEYFGLFAFLNNSYEAQSAVYTQAQQDAIRSISVSIAGLENTAREQVPTWRVDQQAWENSIEKESAKWTHIVFDDMNSVSGLNHPVMQVDNTILMTGHRSDDVYMLGSPDLDGATGLQLEVLNHGDLPFLGPGRNGTGQWQTQSLDLFLKKPGTETWEEIKVASVTADYSSPERKSGDGKQTFGSATFLIDDKPETLWESDRGIGRRNQPSVAVLAFEQPVSAPVGTRFKLTMNMVDNIGCCRFSLTKSPSPKVPSCNHVAKLAIEKVPDQRTLNEQSAIFTNWLQSRPELQAIHTQIDALLASTPAPTTSVLHLKEREPSLARTTHLLDRGEWDQPKHRVEPHTPAALHPMLPSDDPPRLAFAKWLVDKRSPLAARVTVNRVWQAIFGEGLVSTAEDFGSRTPIPEHAELLDDLAVELMENGWSQKKLIKTILMSKTYQQSSTVRHDLQEIDPKNRLLGRGPRFRADAELVRDMALSISGLLTSKVGGASVLPPVPQNVINFNYIIPEWNPPTGPERYRRALYVFRKRSMPDPVMSSLDAPNGDFSCARRVRSNTPLAALTLLNEPVFVEAAQAMALVVLRDGGANEDSRIEHAFKMCMSREPKADERATMKSLLQENRNRLTEGWLNPREIATGDAGKLPVLPPGATPTDAAAWTLACRVLLNLDETISKN
jgi:hypothetical protein